MKQKQIIENLQAVLEAAGSNLEHVAKFNIFLTNPEDFAAMNQVYESFLTQPMPVSSTQYFFAGHSKRIADSQPLGADLRLCQSFAAGDRRRDGVCRTRCRTSQGSSLDETSFENASNSHEIRYDYTDNACPVSREDRSWQSASFVYIFMKTYVWCQSIMRKLPVASRKLSIVFWKL